MTTIDESLVRYTSLFKLASTMKGWNKDRDNTTLSTILQPVVDRYNQYKNGDDRSKNLNAHLCQLIIDDVIISKEQLFNYITDKDLK